MRKDFITFRSITLAQRGQGILRNSGIEAVLQRTPGYIQERGCGYCLRLDATHTAEAVGILQSAGLKFSKVYPGGEERP